MTLIESLTIMLALAYSISLLFYSGKKIGAGLTVIVAVGAACITLYWPLFVAIGVAAIVMAIFHKVRPEAAKGDVRPNVIRQAIHHLLTLSMLLVGLQFAINSIMLHQGVTPWLMRPDVGDAFLPIAGGIELKAIVMLGIWDPSHPAAAVMLAAVLLTGVFCKRAFCGWACPIGLGCEYLYKIRKHFIKGEFMPPAWLDWILRSLKYLILAALLYIVLGMSALGIPGYLNGNYHKVADFKMAYFFLSPSMITMMVFGVLIFITAWRRQGFCRYVCPYGAGLGLLSFLSPFKIRRDKQHCLIESKGMSCDKCTRACPANIEVHVQKDIRSDECQACMRCVSACPKKEALGFKMRNGWSLSTRGIVVVLFALLFMLPLIAYVAGFWHSEVTDELKMQLIHHLNQIGH
ncbi:4Fe-4S binding protein [Shewanella donghaensis]|uniref:4Fe-4S binding protein n=1 Tax=Shewanella donghaensis TaxID=238836 RepID=UPI001182AD7B|nr:4Fe-4S binding protein [Shewanella donghaensis]